jgi:hypothetical protein
MVNTKMTFVFKHPKFYRIPRDKSDRVISLEVHDGERERAPGPGHKPQAPSSKPQAKPEPSSGSQGASHKPQAPSSRVRASSHKRQAS